MRLLLVAASSSSPGSTFSPFHVETHDYYFHKEKEPMATGFLCRDKTT